MVSKKRAPAPGIYVREAVTANHYEPAESEVVISRGGGKDAESSIVIHPWDRGNPSVYVALGYFNKKGAWQRVKKGQEPGEWMENAIFNRSDFVEAILAVFPELKRAE